MQLKDKGISNYFRISVEQAFEIFQKENSDYTFIDVRTENDYEDGVIPGCLKIPLEEIETKFDILDKNKNYILVCNYGGRSSIVADQMAKNDFKSVYSLVGGMLDWNENSYPLESA